MRFCLANTISGPVNIVSPNAVSQHELAARLSERMATKTARIPASLIRCIAGQMGEEVILGGRHASAMRLQESGYAFVDPMLQSVLSRLPFTETA